MSYHTYHAKIIFTSIGSFLCPKKVQAQRNFLQDTDQYIIEKVTSNYLANISQEPTVTVFRTVTISVTRLGNILDFGQLFKAFGKIYLPQSSPFLVNFCKGVKIIHFSSETIFGQLLLTFGDFYLVTLVTIWTQLRFQTLNRDS